MSDTDGMELSLFVKTTLVEIITGIQEAKDQIGSMRDKTNGVINPIRTDAKHSEIKNVDFDVAVNVIDAKSGGGNAGIKVMSISFGGKGEISSEINTTSRIKFSVPLSAPFTPLDQYDFDQPDMDYSG